MEVSEEKHHFTEDEKELLATPDKDLRQSVSTFCFDRKQFEERILKGERWQQLIQAHLYYDHVITRLLVDALANPDAINLRCAGFLQKISFVAAMNLLPAELVSVITFITNLRNKIAHDLNFEITDQAILDFANCTPKFLRDVAEQEDGREPGPLRFNELLRVILFQIEVLRQDHEFNRLRTKKGKLRLRPVLDCTEVIYKE